MMSLPTYEEAVEGPHILSIVGKYLNGKSIFAACTVSKKWYQILNPLLWEDPVKVATGTKFPFVVVNHFMKTTLKIAVSRLPPLETPLDLILTLDFRPLMALAHRWPYQQQYSTFENIMTTQWVFYHIQNFPNLRFLFLDGLKIQRDGPPFGRANNRTGLPFQIQLLSTSGLQHLNNNWIGTNEAFRHVMFLDISYTTRSEEFTQIYSKYLFPNLRILKLRGLRLTDTLPKAVLETDHKLWSLDLRDNLLTDSCIPDLLRGCCLPPIVRSENQPTMSEDEDLFEQGPVYHQYPSDDQWRDTTVPLRPDDKESFIRYMKQNGDLAQHHRPILNERDDLLRPTGVTHLYISGNKFTSLGICRLLSQINRLQVLDVGSVRDYSSYQFKIPYTISLAQPNTVSLLQQNASPRLETLRIHHSIVTSIPTIINSIAYNYNYSSPSTYSLAHLKIAEEPHETTWKTFSPLHNHRISHLTLTSIPTKSRGPLLDNLKAFLLLLTTQETLLSSAQKNLPSHRRAPQLHPGLRTLRLEFLLEDKGDGGAGGGEGFSTSVSGDQDADEFNAQSMGDFSFFEGENGAGGNGGRSGSVGKMEVMDKEVDEEVSDVVEELKKFRKEGEGRWGGALELVVPRR